MRVIESTRLCISTAWICTHQFHLLGVPEAKRHKLDGTGLLLSSCISVFKHYICRTFRVELGYGYFYAWPQIHAPLLSWCPNEKSPRKHSSLPKYSGMLDACTINEIVKYAI